MDRTPEGLRVQEGRETRDETWEGDHIERETDTWGEGLAEREMGRRERLYMEKRQERIPRRE